MTRHRACAIALLILACLTGCAPAATPSPEATVGPQATAASPTLIPTEATATPLTVATVPPAPMEYACSAVRMVELGTYPALENPADVALLGTRAFVAELGGLRVIDAANPAAPLAAGFLLATGGYGRIVTAGDKVIAAAGDAVDLIDVSKPEAPVRVASVPISAPGPIELAWEGGFALARDGLGVVHILEVASAQGLREVSTYNPPGGIWGGEMFGNEVFAKLGRARAMGLPTIAIAGGYLYVADLDGGLRVVSLAQSGRPTEVGARMADLNPSNVASFGDRLFAFSEEEGGAAWSWQLSEFDLSLHPELAEPIELGTLELTGETDLASLCGYLSGFLSLTRSGDAEQSPSGDYGLGDVAGALTGVANEGDTLYLLDPDRGLVVLAAELLR